MAPEAGASAPPVALPVALTVAGSDPSGGAGIQADLKTFHQHGVYGAAALTLLTVQNTRGVTEVAVQPPALVAAQVEAVTSDLTVSAAKTGALGSAEVVEAVAEALRGVGFPVVVDPVMISKHGAPLMDEAARSVFARAMLADVALLTPNAHEAEALTGRPVTTRAEAEVAARVFIDELGCGAVLVKGGHVDEAGDAVDVLLRRGQNTPLHVRSPRIATRHTHGTGCTYSAAITARLAGGDALEEAVRGAKAWLTEALRRAPGVGHGSGPVDHLTPLFKTSA
ncbi:MAG: bifunctional hydroxymethylpyrimidine kinase/phosphomethylpyrimidine kinase [Myxococcota bacterium]